MVRVHPGPPQHLLHRNLCLVQVSAGLQAKDRIAAYDLQTALIQHLHQSFRKEGIVINYPKRSLEFSKDWPVDGPPQLPGYRQAAHPNGRAAMRRRRRRAARDVFIPHDDGNGGNVSEPGAT